MNLSQNDRIAIVFIGHGSRSPESSRAMEQFLVAYRELHPEYRVSCGYIELAKPFMGDALRDAAKESSVVIAVPLLLFRSGHAKNDVAFTVQQVRKDFPEIDFHVADVLGTHPLLAELNMEELLKTAVAQTKERSNTAVLFLGRGSSDPDANADLYRQARLFEEGRNFQRVVPCFEGVTSPSLDEALDFVVRSRPDGVIVLPHFLFTGILFERIRDRVDRFAQTYPWIAFSTASPPGHHEKLFAVIDERIEQALHGESLSVCESCRYRYPMPSHEEHVGGLKALLWSVRHSYTHNQAMPALHTHAKIQKHVFICGNVDCSSNGSIRLLSALRSALKRRGLLKTILVTKTACLGHCGEGPVMAVYPDGIWYRGVKAEDVEEFIDEHILNDRIVSRIVDNIM